MRRNGRSAVSGRPVKPEESSGISLVGGYAKTSKVANLSGKAQIALFVGFAASLAGTMLGAGLRVVSASSGGRGDLCLERLMDSLLAFPLLILALAIASILGPARHNVVIAIAMPIVPRAAWVVRASVLSMHANPYIEAAQALGASRWRTMSPRSWPHTSPSSPPHWGMAVFPGLAISLAVFGFNLFGAALRDGLDPKLRWR